MVTAERALSKEQAHKIWSSIFYPALAMVWYTSARSASERQRAENLLASFFGKW